MTSISRFPQIIVHQQSIARSLAPFGVALAVFAAGLAMLVGRA